MARRICRKGSGKFLDFNVLVLTTVGRKTGTERTTPVGHYQQAKENLPRE